MLVKGMYFLCFIVCVIIGYIYIYMSEEQVSEERDPDLNGEEDIRMDVIKGDHWRYVYEEGGDKKNINALMWEIYVKYNEESIKIFFRCLFHI